MVTILTDSGLRTMYDIKRGIEAKILNNDNVSDETYEILSDVKRDIRKYQNRPISENRIIKDYGIDGVLVIISLPEYVKTREAAEIYFHDFEEIRLPVSAYDCTGRAFTSWYKLFQRHSRWYAYHRISVDV